MEGKEAAVGRPPKVACTMPPKRAKIDRKEDDRSALSVVNVNTSCFRKGRIAVRPITEPEEAETRCVRSASRSTARSMIAGRI